MENQIKTFEDACKALNIEPVLPEVGALPEKHQKAIKTHYMLVIITQALNEGWEPNWHDHNEWKFYPWFRMGDHHASAGVGFSYYAYDFDGSASYVGSRLCLKSSELARYAGKQFESLYRDYFLIE